MKKEKTRLKIVCAWHERNFGFPLDMGWKDGKGISGTTSGICPACAKIEWSKAPKPPKQPARWNLVGRFLARRRDRRNRARIAEQSLALQEKADREADERRRMEDLLATNPALHARVMLTGRRLVHYLEVKDLADLSERVANEPEIRCKWN